MYILYLRIDKEVALVWKVICVGSSGVVFVSGYASSGCQCALAAGVLGLGLCFFKISFCHVMSQDAHHT